MYRHSAIVILCQRRLGVRAEELADDLLRRAPQTRIFQGQASIIVVVLCHLGIGLGEGHNGGRRCGVQARTVKREASVLIVTCNADGKGLDERPSIYQA